MEQILWQRAHLDPEEAGLSDRERFLRRGNAHADEFAKKGLWQHPSVSHSDGKEVDDDLAFADTTALLTARVLAVWAAEEEEKICWKKKPAGDEKHQGGGTDEVQIVHNWVEMDGLFRCRACLAYTYSREATTKKHACPGVHAGFAKLVKFPIGHSPVVFEGEKQNVAACLKCGCWGVKRTSKLSYPCRLYRTKAAEQAMHRLRRGWHPTEWWSVAAPIPLANPIDLLELGGRTSASK